MTAKGMTKEGNPASGPVVAPPPMQVVTKGWWVLRDEEASADELERTDRERQRQNSNRFQIVMNFGRWLKNHYSGSFGFKRIRKATAQAAAVPDLPSLHGAPLTTAPLVISDTVLDMLKGNSPAANNQAVSPFDVRYMPPPGVRPTGAEQSEPARQARLAMDSAGGQQITAWNSWATGGLWGEGLFFPGYPYLAELSQRPEYRHIVDTLADQMTRKWIKLNSTGKKGNSDKLPELDAAMKRYDLRGKFHAAMLLDGFMGMGMIYIDTGATDDPDELKQPLLRDPNGNIKAGKLGKEELRGFVVIDPTWVSPLSYNAVDPLKPDFMVPTSWYVMGKEVHASRLMIFRSRPMPDILKAAYNFGGMSLSQMAKPYVDNWLRTRQSVSDLLHSFTVFIFKTTMQSYLQSAVEFGKRLAAFVLGRDNRGLYLVDKETEDFDNVSAPLSGLDHLQAQAQEQMASVSQQPLIWLLGITPTGLNNSSEPEIRVFYDRVKGKQEQVFGDHVTTALQCIQLSEFGAIDESIGYEFLPLWELDEAGLAAVQKIKADTDAVLADQGAIDAEEVRDRLAADAQSPYHGLEGPPPEPDQDLDDSEPSLTDPAGGIAGAGARGRETGANSGV